MTSLFSRIFPTPAYLRFPAVGFDISDQSIKIAELKQTSRGVVLKQYGRITLAPGIIKEGKVMDSKRFVNVLQEAKKKFDLSFIRASLPEEQVYLFTEEIPQVDTKEIRQTIELSLEQHIPIPSRDTVFDYDIVSVAEKSLIVQVIAMHSETISKYLALFEEAGIKVLSFELEAQSVARVVAPKTDEGTYMVLDIGETSTGMCIVSRGRVWSTVSLDTSGDMLTKAIEEKLGVPHDQAESVKQTVGLFPDAGNTLVRDVLLGPMAALRDELNTRLVFWHTHKNDDVIPHGKVEHVYLCGGNANMKGLPEYLSQTLHLPVSLAKLWEVIPRPDHYIPDMEQNESLSYATALGLALGSLVDDISDTTSI